MKFDYITIEFADEHARPPHVYHPGQLINGRLHFRLYENTETTGIVLKFKGKARVEWDDGDKDRKREEIYLQDNLYLLGKEGSEVKETLYAGEHNFPFQYTLPNYLPTSFEIKHGYVRYYIKAKIFRPGFSSLIRFQQPFTVLNWVDINDVEGLMKPVNSEETDWIGCFCCKDGPISSYFRVDRLGFVPGESIVINAQIDNRSTKQLKSSKVELILKAKLIDGSHDYIRQTVISKLEHTTPTPPGGQDTWRGERLLIPSCPPSVLDNCSIIELTYKLQLTGDIGVLGVFHEIRLLIGCLPLKGANSMFSTGFDSAAYGGGITAPVNPNDITLQPTNPVVTYQPGGPSSAPPYSFREFEHFLATMKLERPGGEKEKQEFRPVYIYYDFGSAPL